MLDYTLDDVNFTNHVLERFVERTMDRKNCEVKQYLVQNEKAVKEKLLKLYNSSEYLWEGKIRENGFTKFYINKDGWVIVVDREGKKLITVYKVDLELGTEFNKIYIEKMKESVENMSKEIEEFDKNMKDFINQNNQTIQELQDEIKLWQQKIQLSQMTIENILGSEKLQMQERNIKEKELQQKMEKFIGAKIF